MTIEDYNKATEILEEIRECKYRINQFSDLVECDPYELDMTDLERDDFIKGQLETKKYVDDLYEIMAELEVEFMNL